MVCLSTDKAVAPLNAMGVSKAMMEKVAVAKSRTIPGSDTLITCTRYGNVMASRGSVIPLFVDQIKAGQPLTVTDPDMTRFIMPLSEALDLVLYAFTHGNQGDLFVQKTPACTVEALAKAVVDVFSAKSEIKIIGTRHGEKKHETLMSREEHLHAEDMGDYYRIPPDTRDLNYNKFFSQGEAELSEKEEYASYNTHQLNHDEIVTKLKALPYIQEELRNWGTK